MYIGTRRTLFCPSQSAIQPSGSISFNGTSQFLSNTNNSVNLQMGTGDFTFEFWMYPKAVLTNSVLVEIGRPSPGATTVLQIAHISGSLNFYFGATAAGTITGPTISNNLWYHVAVTRSSNTLRLFVNGTQIGTTPTDTTNYNQSYYWVGANSGGGGFFYSGNITNIRVVKGIAVYTTNFSPSTVPLTTTQTTNVNGNPSNAITGTQTSLLMGATTNSTLLTDSSTNNFTITNTGSAIWSASTPFA